MLLVFDTNVILSAFLFPGSKPDKILRSLITHRFQHATSPDILTEIRKVLEKKFKKSDSETTELVNFIANISKMIYPVERLEVIKKDPSDNRILECAVRAKANAIISGDKKHILPLKEFQGIKIISPADFVIMAGII